MNETLFEKIEAAEQKKEAAENIMVEMSYGEMSNLFRGVEGCQGGRGAHVKGCIVFTEDSFTQFCSEESRTYMVSSDNKAFQPNMGGYSIFGSSKDGADIGVRLEAYMAAEKGGKNGWKVEKCYMSQLEVDKAKSIIEHCKDDRDR